MVRREALKKILLSGVGITASGVGLKAYLSETTSAVQNIPLINQSGMKVLLVNGSPNKEGNTYTALTEIANVLQTEGIESEILYIAAKPVSGCRGCGACSKTHKCVIDDIVNEVIGRLDEFDGFIFGTPVHYAAASGFITPFLDRLFYASSVPMQYKPGAAIACCRTSGTSSTLDQLNKYFTINNMPIVSSQYWNMIRSNSPEELREDKHALNIMRTLGKNMAWLIKSLNVAKSAGVNIPV